MRLSTSDRISLGLAAIAGGLILSGLLACAWLGWAAPVPHALVLAISAAVFVVGGIRGEQVMRADLMPVWLMLAAAWASRPLAIAGAPEWLSSLAWSAVGWPLAVALLVLKGETGALRSRALFVAGALFSALSVAGIELWITGALLGGAGALVAALLEPELIGLLVPYALASTVLLLAHPVGQTVDAGPAYHLGVGLLLAALVIAGTMGGVAWAH